MASRKMTVAAAEKIPRLRAVAVNFILCPLYKRMSSPN
jgi:hypothetical protein